MVSWSGSDAHSGIASYDVQYRIGSGGAWTNWLLSTTATSATYLPPTRDETYYFRVRAHDNAGNSEAYPASADTSTYVERLIGIYIPVVVK